MAFKASLVCKSFRNCCALLCIRPISALPPAATQTAAAVLSLQDSNSVPKKFMFIIVVFSKKLAQSHNHKSELSNY